MTEADSDIVLLRRSAEGDRAAFSAFMNRHADAVYRFLVSLGARPADAEDALQESFLSAWHGAGAYRGAGSSARGWLFAIARNALRRQYRRRVGEPVEMESIERLGEQAGWGATTDIGARIEERAELEWAMDRLPPAEREAVMLRDVEGLGGHEAAEALGVSLAALKSRLHRGRLRLMSVLRETEEDDV